MPAEGGAGAMATEAPALDLLTVAAAGALVYATALIVHEGAHALTGHLAGGAPTLVSSTDTRGDWSSLGEMQILMVGVSGSAVNGLLALLGWLGFRRGRGRPTLATLAGWLVFAVNAWIPTVYLIVSPALGFGDWATIVAEFPNRGPLRASLTVTGVFIAGLLWKETVPSLARLVGNGARSERVARARRIVRVAWATGGVVAVGASLLSPLALTWAVPVAVGSTWGTTWPLLPASERVGEHPVPGAPLQVPRSPPMIIAGALVVLLLVGVFGPGIRMG